MNKIISYFYNLIYSTNLRILYKKIIIFLYRDVMIDGCISYYGLVVNNGITRIIHIHSEKKLFHS
jgi:hypothetical protein